MSRWAQAKQTVELDWRAAWREIAQGTLGDLDADTLQEARALLDQMESAYQRKDKSGFLALKDQLVKHRSWTGSSDSSSGSPAAKSERPTEAPTQRALAI